MQNLKRIASTSEIPPGKGIKVTLKDTMIAVFNDRGRFFAIQNRCPHQNADLADGYIRNNQVYCPMHNWAFHLKTGAYSFNPSQKLKTYPLKVMDNEIYLILGS